MNEFRLTSTALVRLQQGCLAFQRACMPVLIPNLTRSAHVHINGSHQSAASILRACESNQIK